jgi:hypothetical protein
VDIWDFDLILRCIDYPHATKMSRARSHMVEREAASAGRPSQATTMNSEPRYGMRVRLNREVEPRSHHMHRDTWQHGSPMKSRSHVTAWDYASIGMWSSGATTGRRHGNRLSWEAKSRSHVTVCDPTSAGMQSSGTT